MNENISKNFNAWRNRKTQILFDSQYATDMKSDVVDEEKQIKNLSVFDDAWRSMFEFCNEIIYEATPNIFYGERKLYGKLHDNCVSIWDMLNSKNGFTIEVENNELVAYSVDGNFDSDIPYVERYVFRSVNTMMSDDVFIEDFKNGISLKSHAGLFKSMNVLKPKSKKLRM